MHEKLKFKVQLTEQRGKDSEWGRQPVYSESQYGTHFVINARFEGKADKSRKMKLDYIHFYIQNYTGEITVGMENFSLTQVCNLEEEIYKELLEPEEYYSDSKIYKLTLFLRGLNNNLCHTHVVDHKSDKKNLKELKPGDILVTQVVYLPISKKWTYWDDETKYEDALYVDPLYQIRDGEDVDLTEHGKQMKLKLESLGISENNNGCFNFNSITSFDVTDGIGAGKTCKAAVSMMI